MSLNPAQQRAVEAVDGPVLVYAGPGSGKTRVVTHRIANQVRAGARPSSVVAVTFTDKAAVEMLARLRALGVPTGRGGVRASTFHSAALKQVGYFWPRVSGRAALDVLPSKLAILVPLARRVRTDLEPPDLAAEIEWVKAHGARLDGVADDRSLPAPLASLDLDGDGPRWSLDTEAYARARPDRDAAAIARAFASYEEEKARAGRVDFEDMLAVARALILGSEEVAGAVRGQFERYTVDEFQDVNRLQWDLLAAWAGDRDDICIVGDDDQAIYGFSGADPRYLEAFRARHPDAVVVTLLDNYRSTQPILDLARRALWKRGRHKQLHAVAGNGPAPLLVERRDEDAERAWVVERCRALHAEGTEWQEMAVLYRFNAQSEGWEEAFAEAGIPYLVRGDAAFFERRHVRQALTVLEQAERAGEGEPRPDDPRVVLDGAEPARPTLDKLVPQLFRRRLDWSEREPTGEQARARWADLGVLVDLAEQLAEADPDATLGDYLADLRRRADLGRAPDGGGVNLLTLHRAKGLEFDAVFVVSCEEGRLPSRHAETDEEIREESRLLYVGLTRARRHLAVTWVSRGAKRRSRFLGPIVKDEVVVKPETPASAPQLSAVATGRFEQLKEWRLRTAMADGVPAYLVLLDATLQELARRAPKDVPALLRVPGIGPKKLERYGGELLALMADWEAEADETAPPPEAPDDDGEADPALLDALRDWRRSRARADSVSPFVVFPNGTLEEIARRRPADAAALATVSGVGETKLARYGEEVLAIVAAHPPRA